ncbi:glycosyltransferase family 2 protein [Vibrio vulnificus]|nr:glycosyltransferase family 2 protein [Vibrio vulnificus]
MKKFSLVLCTFGPREEQLRLFLDSLNNQSFNLDDVELIVVDQNEHDRNVKLLSDYPRIMSISKFIKSSKGLSRSRNVGLSYSKGEIVAFPDDDCIYEKNVLNDVYEFFNNNRSISFISTNSRDPLDSSRSLVNFPNFDVGINTRHLIGCSFTLFFREDFVRTVRVFDENMGVGSQTIYGAGEEHDFMIRGMKNGHFGVYLSGLEVYHPVKGEKFEIASIKRRLSYSAGLGYFLIKNRCILGNKVFISYMANQVAMIFYSFKPSMFILNLISFLGLVRGLVHVWWHSNVSVD